MTSAVYERLRREILTCELAPDERLRVSKLKDRFNVSLSIIREALSRLVADGLVHAEDQIGFSVSRVSRADLVDVTNTRIDIECMVLRRAIANADPVWEAAIRDAGAELMKSTPIGPKTSAEANDRYSRLHRRFHEALISTCDSPWLLRFRGILYEQSERYRILGSVASPTADRDVNREHKALMTAVLDRDADLAAELMAEHLRLTASRVAVALEADPAPAPG